MPSHRAHLIGLILSVALAAPAAHAADRPPNYVAVFTGTTLAYHPDVGDWHGHQHDLILTAGYGRFVKPTVALEVDLGPTWTSADYASFSIVPGVVWTISPNAYLAARFPIVVDPDAALYAAPGIGISHTFGNRVTPTLELNTVTRLDAAQGDLGIRLTLGVLYSF